MRGAGVHRGQQQNQCPGWERTTTDGHDRRRGRVSALPPPSPPSSGNATLRMCGGCATKAPLVLQDLGVSLCCPLFRRPSGEQETQSLLNAPPRPCHTPFGGLLPRGVPRQSPLLHSSRSTGGPLCRGLGWGPQPVGCAASRPRSGRHQSGTSAAVSVWEERETSMKRVSARLWYKTRSWVCPVVEAHSGYSTVTPVRARARARTASWHLLPRPQKASRNKRALAPKFDQSPPGTGTQRRGECTLHLHRPRGCAYPLEGGGGGDLADPPTQAKPPTHPPFPLKKNGILNGEPTTKGPFDAHKLFFLPSYPPTHPAPVP